MGTRYRDGDDRLNLRVILYVCLAMLGVIGISVGMWEVARVSTFDNKDLWLENIYRNFPDLKNAQFRGMFENKHLSQSLYI